MATYKQLFFFKFSNKRGNIKKDTKVIDIWNSIEEFLRIVLEPPKENKRKKLPNTIRSASKNNKPTTK